MVQRPARASLPGVFFCDGDGGVGSLEQKCLRRANPSSITPALARKRSPSTAEAGDTAVRLAITSGPTTTKRSWRHSRSTHCASSGAG